MQLLIKFQPMTNLRWLGFTAALSVFLAPLACRAAELQIDMLRPIYRDGVVVSCSVTLSAVLRRLVEQVEGDKNVTFKLLMLSREQSCSSSDYDFPAVSGATLSIAFKRIVVPAGASMSDLLVVIPSDPRLRKACAEINSVEGAVCLTETSRK